MPSLTHEGVLELIRACPRLVYDLLRRALPTQARARLPDFDHVELIDADRTQLAPVEARADAVILFRWRNEPVLTIVFEVQLRRDDHKRKTWPVYLTGGGGRWACPCEIVVFTLNPAVAAWASTPIQLGLTARRNVVSPWVVGRHSIPRITDHADAAAWPELAMLSGMAHGGMPGGKEVLHATLTALSRLNPDTQTSYFDVLYQTLNQAGRAALEAWMDARKHEFKSDFALRYIAIGEERGRLKGIEEGIEEGIEKGREEGLVAGEARALLHLLQLRGMVPSNAQVERVHSCRDHNTLLRWMERALSATHTDQIFAEPLS